MGANVGNINLGLNVDYAGFNDQLTGIKKQAEGQLTNSFKGLGKVVATAFSVAAITKFTKSCLDLGSALAEVQNVVDVTFGPEGAKTIEAFSKGAMNSIGLSELKAKKYTSTLGAMYKSMGLTSDQALGMSIEMTKLAGDMASFYNLDADEAFNKIRSGISGETEPLKQLGINMSVANLEAYALSKGIQKSYNSMTQAEQAMLRYNYLLSTTADAQGDFARTSDSWANQTRVLSLQWESFKSTMGQGFINVLTPMVQGINTLLARLMVFAEAFRQLTAELFGDQSAGASSSLGDAADSTGQMADGMDSAAGSAKKLKKSLAGFDELTIIGSAAGDLADGLGAMGSAGNLDLGLSNVDFSSFKPLDLNVEEIEEAKKKLKVVFNIACAIGTAILAWKLTSFISDLSKAIIKAGGLKAILDGIGPKLAITVGLTLAIAGFTLEGSAIKDSILNGLNGINFGEILGGGLLATGGTGLFAGGVAKFITTTFAGSKVAAAITAAGGSVGIGLIGAAGAGALAGLGAMFAGIYDAIKNKINWLNGALVGVGATAAGAGIGAIIGMCGGPIGAGIGALIGLAVGLITDLVILIVQKWDTIVEWCGNACKAIGQFFVNLWNGIVSVWNSVADWFNTHVIQPIASFFSSLWNGIANAASACWNAIVEFFSPAVEWFSSLFSSIWQTISDIFYNIGVIASGCWEIIKIAWGKVSAWFDETVIQPVATFFVNLWTSISTWAINAWETIKSTFATIGSWIYNNIIAPVGNFFTNLWNGFVDKARAAWEGVKSVFSTVASFFSNTFRKAWEGIVKVFSVAGEIFRDIKDGVVSAFKKVVNGLIAGINKVVAIPFNGINKALEWLRNLEIFEIRPFGGLKTINVPQIPALANGGIVSAPMIAQVGDNPKSDEVVSPLHELLPMIASTVATAVAAAFANQPKQDSGDIVIPIYLNDTILDDVIVTSEQRRRLRTGG